MTTRTNIRVNKHLLEKCHALGLNVSKVCENHLEHVLKALESAETPNTPFLNACSFSKENAMVRAPRFEPGSSAWQGSFDWPGFEEWVKRQNWQSRYVSTVLSYARQYYPCVLSGDYSALQKREKSTIPNILKGLSAVSKFLGCHDSFLAGLKEYSISWVGSDSDVLISRRYNKLRDPETIFQWIRTVKTERPRLKPFMDFMTVTGLRLVEAVDSHGLIVKLSRDSKLNEYYNIKKHGLEHYRYADLFLRRTKKAFFSYCPHEIVKDLATTAPFHNADVVVRYLKRKKLTSRFGDIRELHASFMSSFLNEAEINFLHGRVTGSVYMTHYFNPNLVEGLEERAFRGIAAIQEKLRA